MKQHLGRRFVRFSFYLCVSMALLSLPAFFSGGCKDTVPPADGGNPDGSPSDGPSGPIDPKSKGLRALCPGAAGCLDNKGGLEVAVATKKITPTKYELARWAYYKEESFCPAPTPKSAFGIWRCGSLDDQAIYGRRDCGLDGLCPDDKRKTGLSCKDNPCPTGLTCKDSDKRCYIHYTAPDADGSEKDGLLDWFIDCGRDQVCPCLDPNDKGAYYGKGKKCLVGHKKNPKYTGPDKDGSEGNGKFDGVWMGGFSGNHPLQGFHDDIWARVLLLRTGKTTIAIVSLDLVGFFYNQVQKIREQVRAKLKDKADIDYILISSTHVHEGPDTMGLWGRQESGTPAESGIDLDYIKLVRDNTTDAILEAYNKLKPAKLQAATIQTGGKGFLRDSRDPVIIDDTMHVLRFLDKADDKPIGTLVNWGNHPETLSDGNNFLTSDFPHYLREALEKGIKPKGKFKGLPALGGVAIYLQAAVGGLMTQLGVTVPDIDGTTMHNKSNWDKAEALGQQLAIKVHEALKKKEEIKDAPLSFWAKEMLLTMENRYYHIGFNLQLFHRKGEGYDDNLPINKANYPKVRTEIALIKMGPITFYSMPGELDPQVLIGGYDGKYSFGTPIIDPKNKLPPDLSKAPKGPYFKSKVPGKYKIMVGLGNDELGYILPKWNWVLHPKQAYLEQAEGDHYEETNSIGPATLEVLLKAFQEIFDISK